MSDDGIRADVREVYAERNLAVALAFKLTYDHSYIDTWADESDPRVVRVYMDLPTGQVSWHIPRREYEAVFPALLRLRPMGVWDRSQPSKRSRILAIHSEDSHSPLLTLCHRLARNTAGL